MAPVRRRAAAVACIVLGCGTFPAAAAELVTHCIGQGPPLWLVGGGPAFTTWNLEPIQTRLSRRFRVCRFDMRGVGDNARLPVDERRPVLSQWLDDLNAVVPRESAVVWGHSWGALQAMLFARRFPGRVGALVLSNPVDPALKSLAGIESKRYAHPDAGTGLRLADMGTPAEALHNFRSKIASYFRDAARGRAYASRFSLRDSNGELNVRIWREYRESPLADDEVMRLAGMIAGAIHCGGDVLQPESLAEYTRLLGGGANHVVKDCGHFPWEENPSGYFDVLLRVLGERERQGSWFRPRADHTAWIRGGGGGQRR